jgi:hypothetical protein
MMGIHYAFKFQQRYWRSQAHVYANQHKHVKINMACIEKPIAIKESFIIWIILMFKRIDERDDKEASMSSYFNQVVKIRGGKTCLNITYSHRLKNIAFSL